MITIHKGNLTLPYESFVFPNGDISVRLDAGHMRFLVDPTIPTVVARIHNAEDIMKLALIKSALDELGVEHVKLVLPCVPYAQQDRVCNRGEAFSLKVFGNLINEMDFMFVTVLDPHSDVTKACINNLIIRTQKDIIHAWPEFVNRIQLDMVLVSPDAGANKKLGDIAAYLGHSSFIRADKVRDLLTGKIKETIVYAKDLNGLTMVVIDDICVGGKTFTEVAAALKAQGAAKVVLYVTHGIFSKGVQSVLDGGVDKIWTTNSFRDIESTEKVHVFDIKTLL